MSITVFLQKNRASYVPRFNFGGLFFDKKFDDQIAKIQKNSIFAKNNDFSKISQGYSFQGRGLYFLILTLYIQGKNSVKKDSKIVIRWQEFKGGQICPPPGTRLESEGVGSNRVKGGKCIVYPPSPSVCQLEKIGLNSHHWKSTTIVIKQRLKSGII